MALTSDSGRGPGRVLPPVVGVGSPERSVVDEVIAALTTERDHCTLWTRRFMLLEALALAALGAGGLWTIAHTGASTVVMAGFQFGIAPFVVCAAAAVAIAGAAGWPRTVLPLVAFGKSLGFAFLFVVFGALSANGGAWDLNAAGALLLGGLFIAGFGEFVLLHAREFDPDPGSMP